MVELASTTSPMRALGCAVVDKNDTFQRLRNPATHSVRPEPVEGPPAQRRSFESQDRSANRHRSP